MYIKMIREGGGSGDWIAPRLTDGLCNRLFQIAAAKHYSKKYHRPLVFYVPRVQVSVHSDCSIVFQLFPDIPKVWSVDYFDVLKEHGADFLSYTEFDVPESNCVVMEGYFQCAKYLENIEMEPCFENVIDVNKLKDIVLPEEASKYWWIHIRLGDYKLLPHHQCTTETYWKKALASIPSGSVVLVFSDELDDAREFLQKLTDDIGKNLVFVYGSDLTPIETLYVMSQCGGGTIGSNSSFSWWGQYFSKARKNGAPCILPSLWHKGVSNSKGIYGPWHSVIDV
jgi:hypothetical protein